VNKLRVDVWSDIACPWCYVGKRRLEAALRVFSHRDEVEVVWHAFELDRAAPTERDSSQSYAERLSKKYGTTVERAQGMIQRMTDVAKKDDLDFHFEKVRSGNTFDAHRVIHMAGLRGVQDKVKERMLRAYMTEGEPIGDRGALGRLAGEAGLDAGEVDDMLAGDLYADSVRADEAKAAELGISGVPFFVIGGKYAISGAQPTEVFVKGLEQAWAELAGDPAFEEGAMCGPEGC
jgi:predicted DsbA family dithiol-disulfide isomerase